MIRYLLNRSSLNFIESVWNSLEFFWIILAPESQALESDYFYLINGIRAKEKTGPFTDVSTFDRNDGVIVDQSITQIQQGKIVQSAAVFNQIL